jgi:hypothetical protein
LFASVAFNQEFRAERFCKGATGQRIKGWWMNGERDANIVFTPQNCASPNLI